MPNPTRSKRSNAGCVWGFLQNTVARAAIASISATLILILAGCEHGTRLRVRNNTHSDIIFTTYDVIDVPTNHKIPTGASRHSALAFRAANFHEVQRSEFAQLKERPLNIYGLVVDQDGQPVPHAKVEGSVLLNGGMTHSEGRAYWTETDEQGRFHFTGLHGIGLGIWPQKAGYFYDLKLEAKRPHDVESSRSNPVPFLMWKIKGADPVVRASINSRVPYDATTREFKLNSGVPNGDPVLAVTFWRALQNVKRGVSKYDWRVEIQVTGGFIRPEDDPYPYWAPADGYQSVYKTQMSSNAVPWLAVFEKSFYVKTSSSRFGRISITLSTDSDRPTTGIGIETRFNPTGSQNLEFGRDMQLPK